MSESIVFLPGLGCTGRLFGPQLEALGDGRDVMVGETREDGTLSGMAARILAMAPPRFALVGLSMGGYLALEVVRQGLSRVTRLALLDTSARPDDEAATERRLRLMRMAEAGDLAGVHAALWPRLVHADRIDDTGLEEIVHGMLEEVGAKAFVRQQRAIMGRMDSRPTLKSITVPTLVLAGDEDAITPPAVAYELADGIPEAELEIVEECGHLSTLERPDAVTAVLQRWLALDAGERT